MWNGMPVQHRGEPVFGRECDLLQRVDKLLNGDPRKVERALERPPLDRVLLEGDDSRPLPTVRVDADKGLM